MLTVGAAIIAAIVTLHIAKSVYPVQKNKDREIKIDEEKRVVFREFLKSVDMIINQRLYNETVSKIDAYREFKSALNEVLIFSDPETAKKMWELYENVSQYAAELSQFPQEGAIDYSLVRDAKDAADASFRSAINAARKELGLAELELRINLAVLSASQADQS